MMDSMSVALYFQEIQFPASGVGDLSFTTKHLQSKSVWTVSGMFLIL